MGKPLSIARQSGHPSGLLGWIVAQVMARETRKTNQAAIAALKCDRDDRVLDLGCGHGRAVAMLAHHSDHVTGVDPSHLMVRLARGHNARAIRERRVDIQVAKAEQLSFGDGTFDKVLCVHVIYFWAEVQPVLSELSRVIRPGGTLALVFRDSRDHVAVETFPSEVYRFPDLEEVIAGLELAGFATEARPLLPGSGKAGRPFNLLLATRRDR
ncbi:class I SAM-dependent methyltransferase [Altererythrobacter litoralis]|uniref:Class I SAM-dependent methyltransferase n=1 Tax=Altererythrobacter litoralis TaxID=3113904 RepID=A0ABU7GEU5_9SPHN|nr:class I SAM-dependent methyltransferase [Erythrobacteraceae bacterium 1XM1-14]